MCGSDWCADARRDHVLGSKIVQLPDDKAKAYLQMEAKIPHAPTLDDEQKAEIWQQVESARASPLEIGRRHTLYRKRGRRPGYAMIHYHPKDRVGGIARMRLARSTTYERDLLSKTAAERLEVPPLPTRPPRGTGDGLFDSPHYGRNRGGWCIGCAACTCGWADPAAAPEPPDPLQTPAGRGRRPDASGPSGPFAPLSPLDTVPNELPSPVRGVEPAKGGYKKPKAATERSRTPSRDQRGFKLRKPPPAGYWVTNFEKLDEFHALLFDDYRDQAAHQSILNLEEALGQEAFADLPQDTKTKLLKSFTKISSGANRRLKKIVIASNRMTRKGLAGRCVAAPKWRDGSTPFSDKRGTPAQQEIVWDSDHRMPDGERLINRLVPLAISVTPVTFAHATMFLKTLWLKVPWSTGMYKFIHETVHPAVEEVSLEDEAALVERNKKCDLAFDACHSAVRGAQCTRGALGIETKGEDHGKILTATVSSKGKSASREDNMLRAMIAWSKSPEVDLEIQGITTDESSAPSIIRKAGIESRLDMWHVKKTTRKDIEKFRKRSCPRILAAVRKLGAQFCAAGKLLTADTLFGPEGFIARVTQSLIDEFEAKNAQFESAAVECGSTNEGAWEKARSSDEQMKLLVSSLKADSPPEPPAAAIVNPNADRGAVLLKVQAARQAKNVRKDGTPIGAGQKGHRPFIDDLGDFRLDSVPPPLAPELKAIVSLHRDYDEVTWPKLTIAKLRPLVLQCLPTAAEAVSTFKFEDAVKELEEWVAAAILAAPAAPAANAAPTEDEKAVLLKLEKEEKIKAERKHGLFTTVAEVQVDDLSSPQITLLLKHLKVQRPAGMTVEDGRMLLLRTLPKNPVKEAERAIKRASRLGKKRITSFANHFGHLVRIVNQLYGRYGCAEWKAWWVTKGMLQFRKHCDGKDHSDCNRFLFYSGCQRRASGPASAAGDDVLKSWDHLYTNSAAQPLGVSALAQLNLVMYTLEARFQRRVLGSINFGRTNDMESFFHLVDIISPMYSNMPLALDTHNLHVSKLMWNEGKEHRWAACGQVWGGVGRGGASICRQHAR